MLQRLHFRFQNFGFALLISIAVAILVRGILLTRWCGDFNSDEAIVGLMAKHILEGHIPVFFYGQFYLGSLEAMIAAVIFWLFDDMNGLLLRLSPVTSYLAFVTVSFVWLDRWHNRSTAVWGSLFLALPPAMLTVHTYGANGGNAEMLFLGTFLFLLVQRGFTSGWSYGRVFNVGLVAGLALWTHPLSVFYLFTVLVVWGLGSPKWPEWRNYLGRLSLFIWLIIGLGIMALILIILFAFNLAIDVLYIQRLLIGAILITWITWITLLRWRKQLSSNASSQDHPELYLFWLGLGGILGIAPMIYYFFNPGNSTGGVDNFNFITWQRLPELWQLHLFGIIPALIGLRTHTDSALWLMILSKIGLAAIFVAIFLHFGKHYRQALLDLLLLRPITPQPEHYLWLLGSLIMGFGFINGNNYVIEHIRYFLPMLFVLSGVVGLALTHWQRYQPILVIMLAVFIWGYYGVINWQYYQSLPKVCSAQQVVDFLESEQIKGGQAYYQNAYKLTFLSREKLIIAPYRSRDRYESYTHYVATLPRQTYILEAGSETEQFLSEVESPTAFTLKTIDNINIFTTVDTQ